MRIILAYLRILKKHDPDYPEHKSYQESAERFLATYKQFKPAIAHELMVVNCGSAEHDGLFADVAAQHLPYYGGGFDCGTYQTLGSLLDCDLIVGLNTHAHFWRADWLGLFAVAFKASGPGVYSATASYERFPHLRTPCIAFSPQVIQRYPAMVNTREAAVAFESGPDNFSLWAERKGYAARLVTADGSYPRSQWRAPQNIFRRGDQSNVLVRDRHTELYAQAGDQGKRVLERQADWR